VAGSCEHGNKQHSEPIKREGGCLGKLSDSKFLCPVEFLAVCTRNTRGLQRSCKQGSFRAFDAIYVGVLISLWLFLFAVQPKEFFLGGLKKLEQQSHKCVELKGNM
jgi:hypothetical protein